VVSTAPTSVTNMTGFFTIRPRVELLERLARWRATMIAASKRDVGLVDMAVMARV